VMISLTRIMTLLLLLDSWLVQVHAETAASSFSIIDGTHHHQHHSSSMSGNSIASQAAEATTTTTSSSSLEAAEESSFVGNSSRRSSSSLLFLDNNKSKRQQNKHQQEQQQQEEVLYITKRNGQRQELDPEKIYQRLVRLTETNDESALSSSSSSSTSSSSSASSSRSPLSPLDLRFLDLQSLTATIVRGMYPNVTTREIDVLAAETAASKSTQHADYARLAARILVTQNHKHTPGTFAQAIEILSSSSHNTDHHPVAATAAADKNQPDDKSSNNEIQNDNTYRGFIHPHLAALVRRHASRINGEIVNERDLQTTYFGFKTLERAYLLRDEQGAIVERPQYLWMRVALGIHCMNLTSSSKNNSGDEEQAKEEEEEQALQSAFETYHLMSRGYFTHASPTLYHAGTTHPQLSSCFLVQMSADSIDGIYDTLKRCAVISKAAGGIGLSVHNIRARGTPIRGTRGISNGLLPMLRVYDVTSRYVDQGGGKRPGAFAIYLEPWHADIFDVLNLKKNHGKEEQRARDLFYGLWIPDLFMKRVEDDGIWSLMCPHLCPGLAQVYGHDFDELYQEYERQGRFVRQIRARDLWGAILESQIETGTPYMLYKDACNAKSNQKNLGTIQCSNLCTEIVQYTDEEEVAVCNLASICLSKFVVVTPLSPPPSSSSFSSSTLSEDKNHGTSPRPFGSTPPESGRAYFDHGALHATSKIVTRNLNKIIDINSYPVPGSQVSNMRHRPIGIGVSGLADAFLRLGLPFTSPQAKQLNEAIFETIYHAALEASAELAQEDGPYETFEGSPASRGKLQFNLWGVQDKDTPSQRQAAAATAAAAAVLSTSSPLLQRYPSPWNTTGYDWDALRQCIVRTGLRNSLLLAPMPTASTSQILGVNECFEPFSSNLYLRRVKAGEFIMANPHLLQDLADRGLWTPDVRNQMMRDGGSVQKIDIIPQRLKDLYKTVWEIKMKDIIDMAADRGKFVDQSQSLNLFIADPSVDKLTAMHFYAWKKGLKTGMYYLRTKPAVSAIQYTVENNKQQQRQQSMEDDISCSSSISSQIPLAERDDVCISCSS
jgi:ribonucleoside-diphosphate reductase subunit M1